MTQSHPCPFCGYLVFPEPPGSYGICPVCNWEDDPAQLRFIWMGGANRPLIEAQETFLAKAPRSAAARYGRDPTWRPIDVTLDRLEPPPGGDGPLYWKAVCATADEALEYYWRRSR